MNTSTKAMSPRRGYLLSAMSFATLAVLFGLPAKPVLAQTAQTAPASPRTFGAKTAQPQPGNPFERFGTMNPAASAKTNGSASCGVGTCSADIKKKRDPARSQLKGAAPGNVQTLDLQSLQRLSIRNMKGPGAEQKLLPGAQK